MSDNRTTLNDAVPEQTTCRISGNLVDEAGAALGSGQLSTLVMTLYAEVPGDPIINSISARNILNVNQGTIDAGGNFVITLLPADNALSSQANVASEAHVILLEFTWGSGKAGKHEIVFTVRNLKKV